MRFHLKPVLLNNRIFFRKDTNNIESQLRTMSITRHTCCHRKDIFETSVRSYLVSNHFVSCSSVMLLGHHVIISCCVCVQLHLTLCYPRDYTPSGSHVHGIFQARILELVAISLSKYKYYHV